MKAKPYPPLTNREKQVVSLLAEGASRKEVAFALGIKPKTVDFFLTGDVYKSCLGIFRKLGTNSLALLTQWALKNGIAEWKV